jgi:hypothetical protein
VPQKYYRKQRMGDAAATFDFASDQARRRCRLRRCATPRTHSAKAVAPAPYRLLHVIHAPAELPAHASP